MTSRVADLASTVSQSDDVTQDQWSEWVDLATWQRLFAACYVLESQQGLLLARESVPSLIQDVGDDLPLPAHLAVWDAESPNEWASASQQYFSSPKYVYEVDLDSMTTPLDAFQSSLLLSAHFNRANTSIPYASFPPAFDLEPLLDASPATARHLLTAKLVHVTPICALLAISGESWIFSKKESSTQIFAGLKTTLRTWVTQLWSANAADSPIVQALKYSIMILEAALKEQRDSLTLEIGTDLGIYFAALVLWAVTTASTTRHNGPQQQSSPRLQSQPPTPPPPSAYPPLSFSITPPPPPAPSPPPSPPLHSTTALLSHAQITINTISFLASTHTQLPATTTTADLALRQTGCVSLLMWVQLRLRGVGLGEGVTGRGSEGLGLLLDSVMRAVERALEKGWSGWGI